MRQGGLILAAGRVRSKKKNKEKSQKPAAPKHTRFKMCFLVLYSIRAQNGYGPHHLCKIAVFTLVAPRGVTDLYLT